MHSRRQPSGRTRARKALLLVEVVVVIALLATGLFFLHLQQGLAAELRWARQARAAVDAGRPARAEPAGLAGVSLRRLRIPSLELDYPLRSQAIHATPAAGEAETAPGFLLLLPAGRYGREVCALAKLAPGDRIVLDAEGSSFSFQVAGISPLQLAETDAGTVRISVAAYPCGDSLHDRVLVTATGALPFRP